MGGSLVRILLFIFGGVVAAAGVGYYTGLFDDLRGRSPAVIASLPDAERQDRSTDARPDADAETVADDAAQEQQVPSPAAQSEPGAEAVAQEEPDVPTFDLLRVERDGSIVIAGRAEPESSIQIVAGDSILGDAVATTDGDFAAALDERLRPGDHQIVLRATTSEGSVATSLQTALVSIPDSADGQVLALVDEPGAPSRLITVPEAIASAQPVEQPQQPASQAQPLQPEQDAPDAVAPSQVPVSEDDDVAVVADDEPEPSDPQTNLPDASASATTERPDETPDSSTAAAPDEERGTESPAEDVVAGEVADAAEEASDTATEEANGTGADEAGDTAAEEDVAALEAPAEQNSVPDLVTVPRVAVEAVEIEGDMVFVAGIAEPGRSVRVYANDTLLGEVRADENGRFLIETRRPLPVGDYIVRADLLADDGSVLARAAVPFEREPGENLAAVAPSSAQSQQRPAPAADQPAPVDEGAAEQVAPSADGANAETTPGTISVPANSEEAAPSASAQAPAPTSTDSPQATGHGSPNKQDRVAAATSDMPTAPRLERVDGSVIIRRGDSLWRISRRVYGRGVRYSTIYLANQDQIANPDRIWPGQVFSLPSETEEGEQADLEAIGDQAIVGDDQDAPRAQQ